MGHWVGRWLCPEAVTFQAVVGDAWNRCGKRLASDPPDNLLAMKLQPLDDQEQVLLRQTIGLRCRKARESLGLSQRALAKAMSRSPSWVREIEAGAQYAPAYLIRSLATAAGISVAWFYGEESVLDPRKLAEEILQAVHEGLHAPTT